MGGNGSGRWYRYGKKTTTDDVKRIDVRHVRFPPFSSGILSWSRNGESTGTVGYEVSADRLLLRYRHQSASSRWQEVVETVQFDRTSCRYGGSRVWLLCPHCGTRVAVLYLAGARFLCRHCYRLPYASQNEDLMDRMNRKAWKIRQRLKASGNLREPAWMKPKGMHWKTFERFRQQERQANDSATLAWMSQAQKLLGRGGNSDWPREAGTGAESGPLRSRRRPG